MQHGHASFSGDLYDPRYEHDACGVAFIVQVNGRRSHEIVQKALQVLVNLEHRGASGGDAASGDGAGILIQIPDRFLRREAACLGFPLPPEREYGVGMVFLPREDDMRARLEALVARVVAEEGQRLLGWRDVPVDDSPLGADAARARPVIRQVLIGRGPTPAAQDPEAAADRFERKLYVIRKSVEHAVAALPEAERDGFYIPSLSSQTLIYKGMLTATQLTPVFPDLSDPDVESALALVHQRFSTNTFPTWPLAHPYRFVAHNGEINTLGGNINWMKAREALLRSDLFGDDLQKVLPVIVDGGSDTATFDNVLEFLVMSGRSLPHAVLMMIPEPWQKHTTMSPERRAFYEYHAALMEPWDGPASISFTDGTMIGAVLDRNGLRPGRYCVTTDGLVVMASEAGVLDIPPGQIAAKGRLHPGQILLVDTVQGRIIPDAEIKDRLAGEHPYAQWLRDNSVRIGELPAALPAPAEREPLLRRQLAFGYTREEVRLLLEPMARGGEEAVGSMGTDTPLAILSERPRLLYDYFAQMFAQVTNPPLDAIREELVTSTEAAVGAGRNLLDPRADSCRQIKMLSPILDDGALAKLRHVALTGFRSRTLPILFEATAGTAGLQAALDQLRADASTAVKDGCTILILSDRGITSTLAPIPALLATACVHHHLVRERLRALCGLVIESGEIREVHHTALLVGYGASAVNPYLAFETIGHMVHEGVVRGITPEQAATNYITALTKGLLKVMSKMGISTLQSYCGAQIFEALGLEQNFVDEYFTGTASRISGGGISMIAEEAVRRHRGGFAAQRPPADLLEGGEYQWRREGELHLFNPDTVYKLQHATRSGQYDIYRDYARLVNDQSRRLGTLRGLLDFAPGAAPVPLDEVEPVEAIIARFASGAMSFGSLSQEAHETVAIAMNRLGAKSNSGEGGEDPARNQPDANGDWRRSAIRQVASGRFGVTSDYLVNATDLQIKMAQGAKPGEGGQLPGDKVYPWIAKVRHSTPGVTLISPPPHHDIYSIEDLAQLVFDLKNANPVARVHVKLVAEAGVGTVAAGVAKARADVVLISGHDGGTGASPLTSIKHGGIPWELGLAETQQVLMRNHLRDRIVVQVDGQLKTGRDVVIAALLGAEEFGFATAVLVVSGCVMMRVCHLNTCPVGIATQDPELRKRFTGRPEFVENYFRFVAEEVRELMAQLGFRTFDEMVGRVERLDTRPAVAHWKAGGVDLSRILRRQPNPEAPRRAVRTQEHGLAKALDVDLIARAAAALTVGTPVEIRLPIRNTHRTTGTMLGYEVTRRYGAAGLPDDTIRVHFSGSAGQSFGAFLPSGVTLRLEGEANDHVGKGLSGGRLIVLPPADAAFAAESSVIIGNVALYGATSGEAYVRGIAGERFAVRNSGASAVIEGIGDHGCEYMTGGRVVVLGRTGRNFAAGMSGGIAHVL
ncbi:MAG: glutamate synthase large subunit, partial [Vicinamibacterales bacterium]